MVSFRIPSLDVKLSYNSHEWIKLSFGQNRIKAAVGKQVDLHEIRELTWFNYKIV